MSINFNTLYKQVLDIDTPLDDSFFEKIFNYFSVDLENRKPSPAVTDEGEFVGTDLDLASFLFALSRRNAVVTIPKYKSLKPKTEREGETIFNPGVRTAQLKGLYGNKQNFSFGINTTDYSVSTTDSVGSPRKFTLVDPNGEWYSGWSSIGWKPDAKENNFLTENKLWTNQSVVFSNFVHPNLRNSIYGLPYRTVKLAIQRLTEEGKALFQLTKDLKAKGVEIPKEETSQWPDSKRGTIKDGDAKSIDVMCFEAILESDLFAEVSDRISENSSGTNYLFDGVGEFEQDVEGLKEIKEARNKRVYNLIPALNFIARTMEYAFVKYNTNYTESGSEPIKIKDTWKNDVKLGRKTFDILKLDDNIELRVRKFNRKEVVAK